MNRNVILAEHQRFETERLILRKVEITDAEAMFEYGSDPETVRFITIPPYEDIEATKAGIADFFVRNRLVSWGIVEKKSNQFIGTIDLRLEGDGGAFGWIINRKFWGRGYVPEAAKCLLEFGFNELELNLIWAEHFSENKKSGRVMEKIGMTNMGQTFVYVNKLDRSVRCDYWAVTKSEYEKGNRP